ncbi:MAG: DUF4912 domain-containing protein [Acidobacteriota bacterium]
MATVNEPDEPTRSQPSSTSNPIPTTENAPSAAEDVPGAEAVLSELVCGAGELETTTEVPADAPSAGEPTDLEVLLLSGRGGASEQLLAAAAPVADILSTAPEVRETPTFLSALPEAPATNVDAPPQLAPLPDEYETDAIAALVQDPFRMFVYWEARPETVFSVERLFSPEEVATFRPVLRVTERETETETYYPVLYRGSEWFSVFPDRTYLVEFGVHSPQFGFIRLMSAPEKKTPRGTIAPELPPQPEYRISETRFRRMLEVSGFQTNGAALPREPLETWFTPAVSKAVFTAGDGLPLEPEQIRQLPDSIRGVVSELFERDGGDLAALSLLHYLPALLRDTYLARLAARGIPIAFANVEQLLSAGYVDEAVSSEEEIIEELEWSDWIEDEETFDLPGLQRFGVGSSAGSELGSLRQRRRRRLPRRRVRRPEIIRSVPQPVTQPLWLPSMERPGSLRLSGGGQGRLYFDLDAIARELDEELGLPATVWGQGM